jgi:hypothetical protein
MQGEFDANQLGVHVNYVVFLFYENQRGGVFLLAV